MVWLFPQAPRYAGVAEPPPEPEKKRCSFWMFGMKDPTYSTSRPTSGSTPLPQPGPSRLVIEVHCPAFPEDTNGRGAGKVMEGAPVPGLVKGMPATLAVPPGAARYRFWFGPACFATPDFTRTVPCWPVATDEPASGVPPSGALFITPTWARHPGTGAIVATSVKATVFVEFE